MTSELQQLIEISMKNSHRTPGGFGALIGTLAAHGIESYRVDFREGSATHFLPSGASHRVSLAESQGAIADAFDDAALAAAIRAAQAGELLYPEFVERSQRAGCIGYAVWIAGRKVAYFGRRGETHVEYFSS